MKYSQDDADSQDPLCYGAAPPDDGRFPALIGPVVDVLFSFHDVILFVFLINRIKSSLRIRLPFFSNRIYISLVMRLPRLL